MDNESALAALVVVGPGSLTLLESRATGLAHPQRSPWRVRGWVFLAVNAFVSAMVPLLLPLHLLPQALLLDGRALGPVVGALLGYVVVSFFAYWWHRLSHRSRLLWRWFHQMHHAPVRVDLGSATIFHPFETAVYVLLTTLCTTTLLGLSPEAASLTVFVAQLYGFAVHTNIRTPRWLGYLVQRPEAHGLHHHRRVTPVNYGDLPLWDLLFGTFENPRQFSAEPMGFGGGADESYPAMLRGRDVSGA